MRTCLSYTRLWQISCLFVTSCWGLKLSELVIWRETLVLVWDVIIVAGFFDIPKASKIKPSLLFWVVNQSENPRISGVSSRTRKAFGHRGESLARGGAAREPSQRGNQEPWQRWLGVPPKKSGEEVNFVLLSVPYCTDRLTLKNEIVLKQNKSHIQTWLYDAVWQEQRVLISFLGPPILGDNTIPSSQFLGSAQVFGWHKLTFFVSGYKKRTTRKNTNQQQEY